MKASIAHGWRPSVLILGKDSRKQKVTRTDIVLAKAYQRFLNELCPQCGLPKYMCHTDDNRIQFRPRQDQCASAAVAEKGQASLAKSNEKSGAPTYGVRFQGEPYLVKDAIDEGLEFSDFRRPYLKELAKKQGLADA